MKGMTSHEEAASPVEVKLMQDTCEVDMHAE